MSSTSALAMLGEAVNLNNEEENLGDLTEKVGKCSLVEAETEEDTVGPGPDLLVKHPLQNAWTLWFFKNDKARTWEENQRPIVTVTSVEDFWCLYNHIEVASKLPLGSDYSLFKEGIFPDWEDPRNQVRHSSKVDRRLKFLVT